MRIKSVCKKSFPTRVPVLKRTQICLLHSNYLQRNINNVLRALSVPHRCVRKAADQRKGHKTRNKRERLRITVQTGGKLKLSLQVRLKIFNIPSSTIVKHCTKYVLESISLLMHKIIVASLYKK